MDYENKRQNAIKQWEQSQEISSYLPINFKSGVSFTDVEVKCLECSTTLFSKHVHGKINVVLDNVANIEAIGWCKDCNILTPFYFRVRGDNGYLQLEWHHASKGWLKTVNQKSLLEKVLKWFS